MATINFTVEQDLARGVVRVVWSGITPSDVGQEFNSAGLRLASVHAWGDLGNYVVEASNEITPTNFKALLSSNNPIRSPESEGAPSSIGWVRPRGGNSSIGVAMLFVSA